MEQIKFAQTPKPPYYAVVFSNQRTNEDEEGYGKMADKMVELGSKQPGYLGHESWRDESGFGCTISFWKDMESIKNWKMNVEHTEARNLGREKWYQYYKLRICKIEHDYDYFMQ